MLTFLKDSRNYSDPFIAGQRAASTAAGLTGTVLFPIVSRKLGLVRTGSWSIWFALRLRFDRFFELIMLCQGLSPCASYQLSYHYMLGCQFQMGIAQFLHGTHSYCLVVRMP